MAAGRGYFWKGLADSSVSANKQNFEGAQAANERDLSRDKMAWEALNSAQDRASMDRRAALQTASNEKVAGIQQTAHQGSLKLDAAQRMSASLEANALKYEMQADALENPEIGKPTPAAISRASEYRKAAFESRRKADQFATGVGKSYGFPEIPVAAPAPAAKMTQADAALESLRRALGQ
jgi:hypothetical protein